MLLWSAIARSAGGEGTTRRMSHFEYLAIAFSLVLSFAAIRLVSGLPYALDPERRYVVHVFHVLTLLITTASLFWAFWSFREVAWNYPLFMSALLGPVTVYYLACTLVPDSPSSVASWRAHYYPVRKRYFLGICAWSVVLSLNTALLVGLPLLHPLRAVHAAMLGVGVVGARFDNASVHASIVIVGLVLVACTSILFFLPVSLAVQPGATG